GVRNRNVVVVHNVLRGTYVPRLAGDGHAAAYLARSLSRNFLLWAVTSQACGQKHRSTVHQSCGTPLACIAGMSRSKFSFPVPNGLWVLVLCSLRLPSLSIRWMCVTFPLSRSSSST